MAERRAGLVMDPRCLAHVNPPGGVAPGTLPDWAPVQAFEIPERLAWTIATLEGSGVLGEVERVAAREAAEEELRLAHSPAHVERVLGALRSRETVNLGHEAWASPGSLEPALLAVGGLLEAVDHVLSGALDNAFVVARPPGHHAETEAAMGYCLFNATAIAARHAQRRHGLERVAILDWDVHHGNGTEEIFYADPTVLTVSLHQDGLYPADRGALADRGDGAAAGLNVNVPLPPWTGDDGYALAWERVVAPVTRAFAPDLILVGAGQDPSATDPLGRMAVTVGGFGRLAGLALELASELCGGRLAVFLEGGYSLQHTALGNLAILEALAGVPASFAEDPVSVDLPPGVSAATRAAVEAAERAHRA